MLSNTLRIIGKGMDRLGEQKWIDKILLLE